jgi:hypothetical protein
MKKFFHAELSQSVSKPRSRDTIFSEAQKAESQACFVKSDLIPLKVSGAQHWELERLGFKLGDAFDDMFMHAQLPVGWVKAPSDHVLHSDLFDELGRKRAGIFYRAEPNLQCADMTMLYRFQITVYCKSLDGASNEVAITDDGHVVQRFGAWCSTNIRPTREQDQSNKRERDKLSAQAKAWLRKRRPQWHKPLLHWNEGPLA